jgi:riboflavin-specific deaminase-like protein
MTPPPQPTGPPFVLVNLAMTADGKIATANRAVSSFGSRRDMDHLYELRATADAVMCGARTVDSGRVDLGPGPARFRRLRVALGRTESNLRVIVSGSGSVDPQAYIFRERASPLLILTTARAGAARLRRLRGLADTVRICGEEEIDFKEALAWLRQAWGVERLLCEGGARLNAALFRAGLVHELNLTICPRIFGGRLAPTIAEGDPLPRLAEAAPCRLRSFRRVGDELFLVYDVAPRPRGAISGPHASQPLRYPCPRRGPGARADR